MDQHDALFRTCEAGDGRIGPDDLAVWTYRIVEPPLIADVSTELMVNPGATIILAGGYFHKSCPRPPDHEIRQEGRLRDLLAPG